MKKIILLTIIALTSICISSKAQSLYFPPTTGTTWDTLAPASLGWCQIRIDSLYQFLQTRNTKGFIILKNGKIVLEKYFGTFTQDSINQWASASKSLTSMLTGIAQEQGLLSINDTVSNILGNGWTSCTTAQERKITVHNLITMTSGLNDNPSGSCTSDDVTPACLQYLTTPGTRWAYHTGAYRKMEDVIAAAAGVTYNNFTLTHIKNATGMQGVWVNYIFYSRVRDAARFGLLTLNKGIWATDTLLHDTSYFNSMINTSQNFNLSYGYLWWLNGKSTYMAPGFQTIFTGPLISNAPPDLIAALGKDDQKIYVVPSQNMVVVRLGNSAYGVAAAFSPFDNQLWGYIDSLSCAVTTDVKQINEKEISIFPNPATAEITISVPSQARFQIEVFNLLGEIVVKKQNQKKIDISELPKGLYIVKLYQGQNTYKEKLIKQ